MDFIFFGHFKKDSAYDRKNTPCFDHCKCNEILLGSLSSVWKRIYLLDAINCSSRF